jgi:hypothetical protein
MIDQNGSNFQANPETLAIRKGQGLLTGLLRCSRAVENSLFVTGENLVPIRGTIARVTIPVPAATASVLQAKEVTMQWPKKYSK